MSETTMQSGGKGDVTREEATRAQQAIARRTAEAKATVPDFQVATDVDMDAALALRAELEAAPGEAPSVDDLVVKASALALREQPRANGAWRDGGFERYARVNVGVTVATADALVVPTVFDADRRSLAEIAAETRALAARARAGELTSPELSAGTFTVTGLGAFGVADFTAIVSGGQAAALAIGAVRDEAVVRDGAVVPGTRMRLTLACDHRILYAADAARLLARIRELLEEPAALGA